MVGQERFAYFCLGRHSGFSKVSRCQSGTLSGRNLNNGYVPGPTMLTIRPPSQASQLPHLDRGASGLPYSNAPLSARTWQLPTDIASRLYQWDCGILQNAKSVESDLEGGNPPQETWGSATPAGITHLPAHLLQARSFLRGHRWSKRSVFVKKIASHPVTPREPGSLERA